MRSTARPAVLATFRPGRLRAIPDPVDLSGLFAGSLGLLNGWVTVASACTGRITCSISRFSARLTLAWPRQVGHAAALAVARRQRAFLAAVTWNPAPQYLVHRGVNDRTGGLGMPASSEVLVLAMLPIAPEGIAHQRGARRVVHSHPRCPQVLGSGWTWRGRWRHGSRDRRRGHSAPGLPRLREVGPGCAAAPPAYRRPARLGFRAGHAARSSPAWSEVPRARTELAWGAGFRQFSGAAFNATNV